jgi:hypothetical protein
LPSVPAGMGMGAIQFYPVNFGVSAPQSLTRQLTSDEERLRMAALAALGAPSEYTQRGHVPYPHSTQLELVALGGSDEDDALLTVELDHHLVTAVLVPQGDGWRRVATVVFPTAFADPATTPSTFLHSTRSLLEPARYRAVFHARENQPNGDYAETEAHLRIFNGRPVITAAFVSESRTCAARPAGMRGGPIEPCGLTRRWMEPDRSQPGAGHVELVTASGALSAKDQALWIADAPEFQFAHLRSFSCQPFTFSDASLHFEATGPSAPCKKSPLPR